MIEFKEEDFNHYSCNDCGMNWFDEDDTTVCKKCGSPNIELLKSKHKGENTMNLDSLSKMMCALTHDLSVCETCKKCGPTAAEVRSELVSELQKECMKTFKVIWYRGCLTEDPSDLDFIDEIIKEEVVETCSIEDVKILDILPEDEKKRYYHCEGGHGYVRGILCDDKNHLYDYGSHNKFVWIKQVNSDELLDVPNTRMTDTYKE